MMLLPSRATLANLAHRRILASALLLVCLSILLYSAYFYNNHVRRPQSIRPISPSVSTEASSTSKASSDDWSLSDKITTSITGNALDFWFQRHNSSNPFKYGYREIRTREVPGLRRASVTTIDEPLFSDFQIVGSIEEGKSHPALSVDPLVLDVPAFVKAPVNASQLIFGIQTTVKRLNASIPQLARWLPHTGAKLFVVVIESEDVAADPDQVDELEQHMQGLGFDVELLPAQEGDSSPQRYFSLVNIMYGHRRNETKWISLIDDDTFLPSVPKLLDMLAGYDHEEEYYIGALSEDWWAVSHYGLMGFGGAGVFLSLPLAKIMDENTEDCKNNLRTNAGDVTIMDCIYRHTSTKLTPVPELHQMDISGDWSGFYESGRKHLSLHHWNLGSYSINYTPMSKMHLVADVCGECFLQRWQFGDELILSNAFSIATYPKGGLKDGPEKIDLGKMELTFNEKMDVTNSCGPTRRKMVLEEEKIQYKFLDSAKTEGGVKQLYVHDGVGNDLDTILEILWKAEKTE